jgi:hypothetical protein
MKIEFKWEHFDDENDGFSERAKVIGGWLVRSWDFESRDNSVMAMTFIPDTKHEWEPIGTTIMLSLPFEEWLKLQKDRNDPIGDLASDYIICNTTEKLTHSNLSKYTSSQAVHDALDKAIEEYEENYLRK